MNLFEKAISEAEFFYHRIKMIRVASVDLQLFFEKPYKKDKV